MNKSNELLKNRKLCKDKLLPYGFKKNGTVYDYETKIVDNQFTMQVEISATSNSKVNKEKQITTKVIDTATNEEYVLHTVKNASGLFVVKVRNEYEAVLKDIIEKCYEKEVFKSDDAKMIVKYVRKKYGDELEFLWNKLPDCAIFRRKDNNKWYGLLITAKKSKLGLKGDEEVELFDMRMAPDELDSKVDGKKYFRGYHMNKKSWCTICMNGSVTAKEIEKLIDKSYELAGKK